MIMLLLLSLLTIVRYYDQSSNSRLFVAAVVSALAILVKPFVVFVICAVFVSLAVEKKPTLKRVFDLPLAVFMTVALLPGFLFYGYGIFVSGHLSWKVQTTFLPHLLLSPGFWKGWLFVGSETVGATPLILALLGFPTLKNGLPKKKSLNPSSNPTWASFHVSPMKRVLPCCWNLVSNTKR